MRLPERNIGSLLMVDPALPRRPDGDPYQVLFHFDDESNVTALALTPEGEPLVWGDDDPNSSDDPEEWTAEIAPPEIAAAAWEWFEENQRPEPA